MMRVQFFLLINQQAATLPAFSGNESYLERCHQILEQKYRELDLITKKASEVSPDVLPVVVCGEDFFDGASVATDRDKREKVGKCMDRNLAFQFFQQRLTELSGRYPNVLIIPGSAYLSVDAVAGDSLAYKQEDVTIRKAAIYAQNVMPVFYAGRWERLVKKGDYLTSPAFKSGIKTEQVFTGQVEASRGKNKALTVPKYAEDALAGEAAMLNKLKLDAAHFHDPVIQIAGVNVGLEICGDHSSKRLEKFLAANPSQVDVHIVSSCGIGNIYNAGLLRVQVDAESETLTGVTSDNLSFNTPVVPGMKGVQMSEILSLDIDAKNDGHLSPSRRM
jgi:hypothetical protein